MPQEEKSSGGMVRGWQGHGARGAQTHFGLAAGLQAQAVRGAVKLLGHHAQELCLVLAAVVVGGADVHQLWAGCRRQMRLGTTSAPLLPSCSGGAPGFQDTSRKAVSQSWFSPYLSLSWPGWLGAPPHLLGGAACAGVVEPQGTPTSLPAAGVEQAIRPWSRGQVPSSPRLLALSLRARPLPETPVPRP